MFVSCQQKYNSSPYDIEEGKLKILPDKDGDSKGAKDALTASTQILKYYKEYKDGKITTEAGVLLVLKNYLDKTVYPIASGRNNVKAGGSLPAYQK